MIIDFQQLHSAVVQPRKLLTLQVQRKYRQHKHLHIQPATEIHKLLCVLEQVQNDTSEDW